MLYDHNVPAVCSNFIARLRISVGFDPVFLTFLHATLYALRLNTRSIKQTTGIQNLDTSAYLRERVCIPPLPEQTAIARYLDHADRRIQRYIQATQKRITLLHEARQATIQRAVTRGLNPNVPLKPSGVEWLGDVPAHWDVAELGRIGRFSKGSGGTKADEVPEGIPCIRYGDLYTSHKYHIRASRSFVTEIDAPNYTPIRYRDILFAGSGETIEEIGKSAVNLIEKPACCGGDVILFRPEREMDATFSGYAIDCPQSQYQKSCMGRGITIMHIYGGELKYLWIALPPLAEQTAIAAYLNKATAAIDAAIDTARRQTEQHAGIPRQPHRPRRHRQARRACRRRAHRHGNIVTVRYTMKECIDRALPKGGDGMTNWERCAAVERRPDKLSGAWVFRGTRVPVAALFENLRDGATVDQFLEWFPGVERWKVEAALNHEVRALTDSVHP